MNDINIDFNFILLPSHNSYSRNKWGGFWGSGIIVGYQNRIGIKKYIFLYDVTNIFIEIIHI